MDALHLAPWSDVGPSALLVLTVVLILRGDIVPRRTYEQVVTDRDYWRDAAQESARQVAELTEVSRAAVAALDALPAAKPASEE